MTMTLDQRDGEAWNDMDVTTTCLLAGNSLTLG